MDNNLNNNVENNVNVENVSSNVGETIQVVPTPVNVQSIEQPTASVASNIVTTDNVSPQPVSTTQPTVVAETPVVGAANVAQPAVAPSVTVQPTVNNTGNNEDAQQKAYYKKIYIMMGIIVGTTLLIAGILLYFLLNGTIENRNRLTCTKTIQGEGYQEHIKRYYTFDGGLMKRVYFTHTFTYDNLTDDMYDQTYGNLITNDNHPISKYGLGTNINRDGNVVTITSFEDNYSGEMDKDILKKNKSENFTCE